MADTQVLREDADTVRGVGLRCNDRPRYRSKSARVTDSRHLEASGRHIHSWNEKGVSAIALSRHDRVEQTASPPAAHSVDESFSTLLCAPHSIPSRRGFGERRHKARRASSRRKFGRSDLQESADGPSLGYLCSQD